MDEVNVPISNFTSFGFDWKNQLKNSSLGDFVVWLVWTIKLLLSKNCGPGSGLDVKIVYQGGRSGPNKPGLCRCVV